MAKARRRRHSDGRGAVGGPGRCAVRRESELQGVAIEGERDGEGQIERSPCEVLRHFGDLRSGSRTEVEKRVEHARACLHGLVAVEEKRSAG